MLSRWIRTWYSPVLWPLLNGIGRLGIGPNALTIASLIIFIIAGIFFAYGKIFWGAWLILFGGFLDGLDGELARVTFNKSAFGGFLDSVCDHIDDFAMYLGLLWFYLKSASVTEVALIFVAMFASVFGSHVRSRGRMVSIDTKDIGMFTRCERIFILFFGIVFSQITTALWVLAIMNAFSALQRVLYTIWFSNEGQTILQDQTSESK
jgi:phosphatidylinositol phosphate synthase